MYTTWPAPRPVLTKRPVAGMSKSSCSDHSMGDEEEVARERFVFGRQVVRLGNVLNPGTMSTWTGAWGERS